MNSKRNQQKLTNNLNAKRFDAKSEMKEGSLQAIDQRERDGLLLNKYLYS